MQEKFYITMAIPYASQKPHIGNSYEGVLTDAVARYNKQLGKDVFFLTGIDAHGQKIEEAAKTAGVAPLKYTQDITEYIKKVWKILDVDYDKIISTTDDYHKEAVNKIFEYLYNKGDIYKGTYTGWYCVPDESFFTDSQIIDGKCPDCGREVEKADEESYFLKLSKYQKRLEDHLEQNPDFVVPHTRRNEIVNNFIKPGLIDLAVTRTSFNWGIHPSVDKNHVIYVWIDALANYITALGYDQENSDSELFKKYWPADVQIIGKDVLRFHMIYWPIMLMALDIPLPKQIFAHPWLLINEEDHDLGGHRSTEGVKMSKSVGNVVYAEDFVKHFGTDPTRYYILSTIPFANDSAISYKDMIMKYNADLANTIGNLVNRTITMNQKYFSGIVQKKIEINDEFDEKLYEIRRNSISSFKKSMDAFHLSEAIRHIMDLGRACNKYIDETMPWVLANDKSKNQRLGTVLYNLLENIRVIGILLASIMPTSSKEILRQIGVTAEFSTFSSLDVENGIIVGSAVSNPEPIFLRLDEKKKLEEISEAKDVLKLKKDEKDEKENDIGIISFEDFLKVKMISAQIKSVETIENSDMLLKLLLDDGSGELKQVVSGIAKSYSVDELLGRKVAFVSNLKPVKLRGINSNGMILAASKKKKISLIFLEDNVENGWEIS